MPWSLLLNRWVLGALAFAALVAFLAYQKGSYDDRRRAEGATPYITAIAAQKAEAAAQLSAAISQNARREEADRQRAITNQKDYDESLKALVDSNRKYAGQLRDPGRRDGGRCPGSEASPRTGATQDVPVGGRISDAPREVLQPISDEAAKFLRKEADLADKITLWGKACNAFVNR